MIRRLAIAALCMSGCVALSPPPIVPRHASTLAPDEDTFSVSLVMGVAMSGFADTGFGGELRAAYQASPDVEVGIGIGLGTASADVEPRNDAEREAPLRPIRMVSMRAYTAVSPRSSEHVTLTAGVGALRLSTGMIALTADLGATVGYPNDILVPTATLVTALSMPLRPGRAFGSSEKYTTPEMAFYGGLLFGLGGQAGDHYLSLEAGGLRDVLSSTLVLALSGADRVTR